MGKASQKRKEAARWREQIHLLRHKWLDQEACFDEELTSPNPSVRSVLPNAPDYLIPTITKDYRSAEARREHTNYSPIGNLNLPSKRTRGRSKDK